MEGILGAIAIIGGIVAVMYGWDWLKSRNNKLGRAAEATGEAAGAVGRGLVRIYGVAIVALGGFGIFAGVTGSGIGLLLGGLVLVGYGIYLLFGGSFVIW